MHESKTLKVLVMEQEENLRHWLGRLLDRTEGFQCVGYCPGPDSIKEMVAKLGPEMLLLDWRSASSLPAQFLLELKAMAPGLCVVFMDLEEGPCYERRARHAGADGFLSKARVPEDLESLRRRFFPQGKQLPRAGA